MRIHATVVLAASLLGAAPPEPIINGVPDLGSHSAIGLLAYDFDGAGPIPWAALCTGSVISDHAFLTAAHCLRAITSPVLRWGVTLDGGAPGNPVTVPKEFGQGDLPFVRVLVPITPATSVVVHPHYGDEFPRAHDFAVLLFPAETFENVLPVALPAVGRLDQEWTAGTLAGKALTLVGYGADRRVDRAGITFVVNGLRQTTTAPFQALTARWLRVRIGATTDAGGLCHGDSGSPYLDGNVALAIHSGDASDVCAGGVMNGTRLDSQDAHDFLSRFVQ